MYLKQPRLIIAIKFGDNDFWSTFHLVLKHIYQMWTHVGCCSYSFQHIVEDKNELAALINSLVALHSKFEIHGPLEEHLVDYLKVSPDNIYIGDEAVKYLEDPNNEVCWNGETFVLDTYIYDENWTIYSK